MKFILPVLLLGLAACGQTSMENTSGVDAFTSVSPEVTTARHNGQLYILGSLN